MPLTTYAEARPWAKAIRDEVLQRRMPQWGAIKGYGEFANDIGLSQDEINRIAEWVEGGAPEGDPQYLPSSKAPSANPPPRASGVRSRRFAGGTLTGIRPVDNVVESKITAHLPDGSILPLLWLRGYRREWNRTFVFARPMHLPRGTSIQSHPPASLQFFVKSPPPGR